MGATKPPELTMNEEAAIAFVRIAVAAIRGMESVLPHKRDKLVALRYQVGTIATEIHHKNDPRLKEG